jgi:GNAT superfamily N-acetyltransferase
MDNNLTEIAIRSATSADIPQVLHFVRELAEYERALQEVTASEQDLHNSLFNSNPQVHALICSVGGETAGFAVYFFNYSTWLGKHGLFLEDLYISPQYRGNGAGNALFRHLAKIARAGNCGRMEWNVLNWNEPAIRFYESLAARPQSEWTGYRLTGNALLDLAGQE